MLIEDIAIILVCGIIMGLTSMSWLGLAGGLLGGLTGCAIWNMFLDVKGR